MDDTFLIDNFWFKSNQNKFNLIDLLNVGFSFERTKSRLPSSMINPSILSMVILTILSLFSPRSSLKIHGKPLYKFLPIWIAEQSRKAQTSWIKIEMDERQCKTYVRKTCVLSWILRRKGIYDGEKTSRMRKHQLTEGFM